jgi:hypothetical protein
VDDLPRLNAEAHGFLVRLKNFLPFTAPIEGRFNKTLLNKGIPSEATSASEATGSETTSTEGFAEVPGETDAEWSPLFIFGALPTSAPLLPSITPTSGPEMTIPQSPTPPSTPIEIALAAGLTPAPRHLTKME